MMINEEGLKARCSVLDIFQLKALLEIGNNQYDEIIGQTENAEEVEGLVSEKESFNEIVNKELSNKFFDFID